MKLQFIYGKGDKRFIELSTFNNRPEAKINVRVHFATPKQYQQRFGLNLILTKTWGNKHLVW